jgi:dipeptidyl-peptidase-4
MSMRLYASGVAVVLGLSSVLGGPLAAQRGGRKPIPYDQAFRVADPGAAAPSSLPARQPLLSTLPVIVGWLDEGTYLESRQQEPGAPKKIFAVTVADGSSRLYRDYADIQTLLPKGVDANTPESVRPDLSTFIYSDDQDLYRYDAAAKDVRRLTATPSKEQNARFSPDGRSIAYTRDNNLFVFDLEHSLERQLTTDGSDTIYNGRASWVYYEEILGRSSNYAAFWWSPDSRRLAFMRFDDGPVPTFPIFHEGGPHGELEIQRYPKAGDPNPFVAMGIANVGEGTIVWTDFEPKADHYIAWPVWTPDSRTLMVQWMNRGQDTIRFYHCDVASGKKTAVFEERQSSWVDFFEDVNYLADGRRFLLRSSVDGWDHLYVHDIGGGMPVRLTSGDWRVTAISRLDEKNGYVYFLARRTPSWDTRLMRVRLDGSGLESLTNEPGVHATQISPGGTYFIDTVSTTATPAEMTLRRADGSVVRSIASQRTAAFDEYAWGKTELFTIPSGDGFDLPAWWVLPADFNPQRQYPVIVSIYGGPDAGTVLNRWLGLPVHYWAGRGVITISVDHRGSGHFGKKGVALMHRQLGKWEIHDLIAAAKWLRSKPFVAKDRIGITGSSYGGYTTLMALTRGAGHFNAGDAGSPVTDWRLYDTVYTERYMDAPAENPDGYKQGAVLTWIASYAGGLRLSHGTTDDNVHMQNSLQVIEWLTTHDKRFELMIYPGSRHAFAARQRVHSYRDSHDFWVRTFFGSHRSLE